MAMLRAAFFVLYSASLAIAEPGQVIEPRFGKASQGDTIRFSEAITADHRTSSILIEKFELNEDSRQSTLAFPAVKTFSFSIPVEIPKGCKAAVTQDIRGMVATKGSGSVALATRAGGRMEVADLKAAIREAEKQTKGAPRESSSGEQAPEDHQFLLRLSRPVTVSGTYVTTLIILADAPRGDPSAMAAIYVDSVETLIKGGGSRCGK